MDRVEFISRSKAKHGDKFDYSLVPEKFCCKDKVSIICPVHGMYKVIAEGHYSGTDCAKCARERFDSPFANRDVRERANAVRMTNREAERDLRFIWNAPVGWFDMLQESGLDSNFSRYSDEAVRALCEHSDEVMFIDDVEDWQKLKCCAANDLPYFLLKEGSEEDLLLRGVVPFKGAISHVWGIDKFAYKCLHVWQRCSEQTIDEALRLLGDRAGRQAVKDVLGVSGDKFKLKHLFAVLGRSDDFEAMQRSHQAKSAKGTLALFPGGNPRNVPEINQRIRDTCLRVYGCENPFGNKEIQAKRDATMLDRYGARHTAQVDYLLAKMFETRRLSMTFSKSKAEDRLYDLLVGVFSAHDVRRQYLCDRYPFHCDFYVASRDMFIELNAHWTHGFHWFDESSADDIAIRDRWLSSDSDFYQSAVRTWCVTDLIKKQTADVNGLNYIVFWDWDLQDALRWFDANCPDSDKWMQTEREVA